MYSRWRHNKRRAQRTGWGATIGGIVGGSVGYAVGFVVIPIFQSGNEVLRDPYACGATGGFLGLLLGLIVGARLGEYSYRKRKGAEFRAARKERFPINAFGEKIPEPSETEDEEPPQWRSKRTRAKRKPKSRKDSGSLYP